MMWRVAKSLETLRAQVNAHWPNRDKSSDGTIGDAAHASRSSDHNPWVKDGSTGVVTGMDITHDPKSGCDAGALAEALRGSRDARIKYVISNARICSGSAGPSAWTWRAYTGSNAHRHHVHLSVKADKAQYDSTAPWTAVSSTKAAIQVAQIEDDGDPPDGDTVEISAKSDKPGFIRRIRNWVVGTTSGVGGLGFLAYLTDWQVVAVLCVFVSLTAAIVVAFVIWFFGAESVREWVRKQVA